MVFGKHIIIDANECNENKIKDLDNIKYFIDVLCKVGNMEKKGDLIIELFPENDFNIKNDLVGYSIVQIISLSNITLHINFISKTVYFDYFTCSKDLKENEVINLFTNYFNPKTIKKIILERDAIDLNLSFVNN
jgi:S-adenosylmethionine/arginine decarboxylase-like enzyme